MADYGRPYGPNNQMEIAHYPKSVNEYIRLRLNATMDERDWVYHTFTMSSPELMLDICERIFELESRVNG